MDESDVISISRKDKTILMKDGRRIPLDQDLVYDLLGSESAHEKEAGHKKQKTQEYEGRANFPFGDTLTSMGAGFSDQNWILGLADKAVDSATQIIPSFSKGKGQEGMGFLERLGENTEAISRGRRGAAEERKKLNPNAYFAGQVGGFGSNLATPLPNSVPGMAGMSGLMGAGISKTNPITNPGDALKEFGVDAALGGALGWAGNRLTHVANERGALRAYPGEQAEHGAQTALQGQQFAGQQSAHQAQVALQDQKFAADQAAHATATAAQDQKFVADQLAHKTNTAQVQKQFIDDMAIGLEPLQHEMAHGVARDNLKIGEFIDKNIGLTSNYGTPHGDKASKFLANLSTRLPENMSGEDVKKVFVLLEERIALASPEEAKILNAFKDHLVHQIPLGAASNATKAKYAKSFLNYFDKAIEKTVNAIYRGNVTTRNISNFFGGKTAEVFANDIKKSVRTAYNSMSPIEFAEHLKNGTLQEKLSEFVVSSPIVNKITKDLEKLSMKSENNWSVLNALDDFQSIGKSVSEHLLDSKAYSSNLLGSSIYEREVVDKVAKRISNATGVQNPHSINVTTPRNARPSIGPSPTAPSAIPPPVAPSPIPGPVAPTPIPQPQAPQVGRAATFFENPQFYADKFNWLGSRHGVGLGTVGALAHIGGFHHTGAVAGTAAGALGLTAALRGITSPTAMGAYAREGIQRGGMALIVQSIAEKYPSYSDGVLADPQERRSAVAEIEQAQHLDVESKAVLQAKINRGQNIEKLIQEQDRV